MYYTDHARMRMQQRGFSTELAEFVRIHGECFYFGGRRVFRCVNQGNRNAHVVPSVLREKLRKSPYIVVDDNDEIVTVGWRYKPLKSDYRPHYQNARRKRGRRH